MTHYVFYLQQAFLSRKLEELSSLWNVTASDTLGKLEELETAYHCTLNVGS